MELDPDVELAQKAYDALLLQYETATQLANNPDSAASAEQTLLTLQPLLDEAHEKVLQAKQAWHDKNDYTYEFQKTLLMQLEDRASKAMIILLEHMIAGPVSLGSNHDTLCQLQLLNPAPASARECLLLENGHNAFLGLFLSQKKVILMRDGKRGALMGLKRHDVITHAHMELKADGVNQILVLDVLRALDTHKQWNTYGRDVSENPFFSLFQPMFEKLELKTDVARISTAPMHAQIYYDHNLEQHFEKIYFGLRFEELPAFFIRVHLEFPFQYPYEDGEGFKRNVMKELFHLLHRTDEFKRGRLLVQLQNVDAEKILQENCAEKLASGRRSVEALEALANRVAKSGDMPPAAIALPPALDLPAEYNPDPTIVEQLDMHEVSAMANLDSYF